MDPRIAIHGFLGSLPFVLPELLIAALILAYAVVRRRDDAMNGRGPVLLWLHVTLAPTLILFLVIAVREGGVALFAGQEVAAGESDPRSLAAAPIMIGSFASYVKAVIVLIGLLALILGGRKERGDAVSEQRSVLLILAVLFGSFLLCEANDYGIAWLGTEIAAVAASAHGASRELFRRRWRLGIISSMTTLLGIALMFGLFGSVNFSAIGLELLRPGAEPAPLNPLLFAMLAILLGTIGRILIAFLPAESSSSETRRDLASFGFFRLIPMIALFALLVRLTLGIVQPRLQGLDLESILGGLGAIMLLSGSLATIREGNGHRLIERSGTAWFGFAMMALLPRTGEGLTAALLILLLVPVVLVGAFNALDRIVDNAGSVDLDYLRDEQVPPHSIAVPLAIVLLFLAGAPLSGGFLLLWFASVGVLGSVASPIPYLLAAIVALVALAFGHGRWIALLLRNVDASSTGGSSVDSASIRGTGIIRSFAAIAVVTGLPPLFALLWNGVAAVVEGL